MVYKKIIAGLGVATALGIAALPVAGTFAADPASANVNVTVNVGSTIAIATDGPAAVSMTPHQTASSTGTVTVSTNNLGGYKLAVRDADSDLALKTTGDEIPARGDVLTAGTAGWNITGGNLSNKAITATDQIVRENTNSNHTAITGEVTSMTYNFATNDAQLQGQYVDTIVYTATAL